MRWLFCVAVLLVAMGPIQAAGYDDFTTAMTANLRGEYEAAEAAFAVALAAPDLVTAYKPAAYRGRAAAYLNQDKCKEAQADIVAFQALRPDDQSVVSLRLWANLCLKNSAAARKDLAALTKDKASAGDLWEFSRLEWRYGLFAEAAATAREAFTAINKDSPDAPYILIWQAMSALRGGSLDAAAIGQQRATLSSRAWPGPVLDLYLGKQTPQGVQAEAESWSASLEETRLCEARFYTAEWHLARNETQAATALLLNVMQNCPIDLLEQSAAGTELKHLGVQVPKE